ncbi:energy transducer TonB [Vibrio sp. SCSIO 43136]|uniref:energy transducer TonB n=1 Tax=Vibrio sp. SCSIO 43136 TaxID=2819101 RepID=UPI0020752B0B|nr:energy transducer TonB [Vibrio sp. SCSIO 43136]USD66796.1 TonB family protein [Vibrio sp. SCSIO 43136]
MDTPRYVIAGGLSLVIHVIALLSVPEHKAVAMPAGSNTSIVSINLVASPQPKTSQSASAPEPAPTKDSTPEPVEQVADTPPKVATPEPQQERVEKQSTPVKKKAVTPEKKVVAQKPKPAPRKVTKKKTNEEPKPTTKKQAKPKPEPKKLEKPKSVAKKDDTNVPKTEETPVTHAQSGANAKNPVVENPEFKTRPVQPNYPRLARKRGIEGVATYEIWLDEDGRQIKQVLMDSSGTKMLDKAALKAIKQWQFSPHQINGISVAHRVLIPVRFSLD